MAQRDDEMEVCARPSFRPCPADAVPVMIWIADADRQYRYFNQAWLSFTGRDLDANRGEGWLTAVHPEDRERCVQTRAVAFDSGQGCEIEYRLRRHDGEYRWIRDHATPRYDEAGRYAGLVGSAWDVTDLVNQHAELRLAASVFEHANEGIVITDAHERIVAVNRSFTRITGYEAAEVVGHTPKILSAGRNPRSVYDEMWAAVRAEGTWTGEIWNRRKNGEEYPERLSIRAVYDGRERISHYIGMFIDVSDLRRARDFLMKAKAELESQVERRTGELRMALRELEAFSYSVSHDLRAPLRAIDGYSALVQQECADYLGAPQRNYLERIRAAVGRMSSLIDDLLELSQVARRDLEKSRVNLSDIVEEIVNGLREREPGRQVEFRIGRNLHAIGDPVLLRAVLENLIGNAWKYTSKNPRAVIEFGCERRDGREVFYVRDDGVGFDMNYVAKLFKPFQRLHSAAEFPGTGIGLATVARIIERHGGDVAATSMPGGGAVFSFSLQRRGSEGPGAPPSAEAA